MRISVTICDHCGVAQVGSGCESYRVEDGPVLDICEVCQKKPFRKVSPTASGLDVKMLCARLLGLDEGRKAQ